jgi:hypothetical protein
MTDHADSTVPVQPTAPVPAAHLAPTAPAYAAQAPVPYGAMPPSPYGSPAALGLGKIRGTGMCIFLSVITFGIYTLVWWYSTHEEMKRHTGQGMGGGLALVLAFLVGIVMPYITSSEIGSMYERAGMRKPVSGATGLWYFPGVFILVGPLVWFIKTNGALNAYWRAQGVR